MLMLLGATGLPAEIQEKYMTENLENKDSAIFWEVLAIPSLVGYK